MSFEDLTACDLMSTKIESCSAETSVMEALKRMDELQIHCLLVPAPEPGRSMGIISAKDVVQLLGDAGPLVLEELSVGDVMTAPIVTLPDYLKIPDCINLMRMTGVRSAPIMRGKDVAGILSFTDVLSWIARNA